MHIVPVDDELLRKLTGTDNLPDKITREYNVRRKLFDMAGGSGPLGVTALIDLLRFCDFKPPQMEEPAKVTIWNAVAINTRVEALFFGNWMPGTLVGFADYGMLQIRFDGDSFVKECSRHNVRISDVQAPPAPLLDGPDARLSLIEPPLPKANLPKEEIPLAYAKEYLESQEEPGEVLVNGMDWSKAEVGAPVWVQLPDDVVDATFVRLPVEEGQVIVEINGSECLVPMSSVTYADEVHA